MTFTRAVACVVCVGLAGCEIRSARATVFNFDRDAGLLIKKNNQTCVEIGDSTLANQTIHFVATTSPQSVHDVRLNARSTVCAALFNDGGRFAYYDAQSFRQPIENGAVALVVATTMHPLTVIGGTLTTDLDGDGHVESFTACTSREGVHLGLWDGAPPTGHREWHRYVQLGYDVDPTCSGAESAPDSTR
ncbi:MAG TPA: hypothetical protein VGM82_21330 [Gemmatimonadaceae bacterium]|jgi:hypothetical protein